VQVVLPRQTRAATLVEDIGVRIEANLVNWILERDSGRRIGEGAAMFEGRRPRQKRES